MADDHIDVRGAGSGIRSPATESPSCRSTARVRPLQLRSDDADPGEDFRCIDYDQRGYGQSEKPEQDYDLEVWADDATGMLDVLGIEKAHIHGTSMGGMVATIIAGKYPDRVQSVVINCAAAKLGFSGRLVFKNWIDLIKLEGCGSRILAELISWQCLSRGYMATPEGQAGVDVIQQILRDANEDRVMIAGLRGDERDGQPRLGQKITSPALVIGGDEDVMTPWDQGPDGAGQQWIADNLPNGETYVVKGGNHSTIFDSTEDHARAVTDFFRRHAGAA